MHWDQYNETGMKIIGQQYPGAGMRFSKDYQWIRFREQFEDFICKSAFIRGLEKVKLDNGSEVLWACGTFGSFPKVRSTKQETESLINKSINKNQSLN